MQWPASVLDIATKSARKHADDIDAAVVAAEKAIRKLDEFGELIDALITDAIRQMVYEARHASNTAMKRQAGVYGQPAKVQAGTSEAVQKLYSSVYQMRIAGTMLGLIRGSELPSLAETERSIASGHTLNAVLIESLIGLVGDDKTVQQCVSEKKLKTLLKKAAETIQSAAA
jgi:hypothetical protein